MYLLLQLAAASALMVVAASAGPGRLCELPPDSASEQQPSPEQHPNRVIVKESPFCGFPVRQVLVGGHLPPPTEYPWVALLGYSVGGSSVKFECSGALISDQHVLTAAHCVSNLPRGVQLKTVRLGDNDASHTTDHQEPRADSSTGVDKPQNFGISKVLVHGEYNVPTRYLNDIALLKLDKPVTLTTTVQKICLPFDEAHLLNNTKISMSLIGYGYAGRSGGPASSAPLREVKMSRVEQRSCAETVCRFGGVLGSGQMCAGGTGDRDKCLGKPGGLLMVSGVFGPPYSLVGVNSGVSRCGISGVPSIFTRVSLYLNWILDRLGD